MNRKENYFFQFFGQFSKDLIFVEELSLISVLEVFGDSLSHLTWKFAICHVLLNLFDLKKQNKTSPESDGRNAALWFEVLESILPNYDFLVFPIFTIKLGHFKVQAIFSYTTNTQAL